MLIFSRGKFLKKKLSEKSLSCDCITSLWANSAVHTGINSLGKWLCQTVLTCSGQPWLQGHGVRDAPQGQSARRVSLDQQLVEGFPSAEEELSHGRTDQELKDKKASLPILKSKAAQISSDLWHSSPVWPFLCLRAMWSWNVWFCFLVAFRRDISDTLQTGWKQNHTALIHMWLFNRLFKINGSETLTDSNMLFYWGFHSGTSRQTVVREAKTKNSFIAHHHVGSNIPSVCVQSLKTLSWPRRGGTMWRYRYLYCVYLHIHQGFTFHVTTILVSVRVIRSLSLRLLLSTDRCVYSVKNHRHGPLCQVWIHEPYRFHREAGPGEMRPLLLRNSTPLSCHCDDDFMSCMSGIQHEMSDLANKTEHIIRGYWWIMVEMGWGQHTCFFPTKRVNPPQNSSNSCYCYRKPFKWLISETFSV